MTSSSPTTLRATDPSDAHAESKTMHRLSLNIAAPALVALLLVSAAGCKSEPAPSPPVAGSASLVAGTSDVAPASAVSASPPAASTSAEKPAREIAGAAHVLVAYKGAEGAPKGVTRSREEAQKRAAEAAQKIKDGLSFEDAVKKYSDDVRSTPVNGALGNFERNAMPKAFSDAAFAMKVGEISGVVETPNGFHIIKRTR